MPAVRSRLAVAIAAIGLFAATCLAGDRGAARAAVGQATGPLIGSSAPGTAILAAQGMAPGDVRTGEITLTNVGDTTGTFALGSTGAVGGPLAHELDLLVWDLTTNRQVYAGALDGLASVGLGAMGQGDSHRYRFTVSLPSSADDSYQGGASAVTFVWSATAPDPEPVITTPDTTEPGTGATGGTTPSAGTGPAPARTAESPPRATVAGVTVKPGATLSVRTRQHANTGTVAATVTCQAGCRVILDGTASFATKHLKLHAARHTLRSRGRVRMRVALPGQARLALDGGRSVLVRLRLRATFGTRTVVSRRTVRLARAPR